MELTFGVNVREHGDSIGRLAGVEVDRRTRIVRHIIMSPDGSLGPRVEKRPLVDVPADHFGGEIVLRGYPVSEQPLPSDDLVILTDATRVVRGGRQIGHLSGVDVSSVTGELTGVSGRQHWWTRRFHIDSPALDLTVPGEVRVGAATSQAA